jgi:asparagine synthase (glutamine-hydrolysing)
MLAQYSAERSDMLADMLVLGIEPERLAQVSRGELASACRDYQPRDTVRALLARLRLEEVGLVDAMRYLDLKLTLAGDILVKVDRASMAVALEVRPVYLHRDLLDLSARIPAAKLATPSSGKQALKSAFEPWLPNDLIYRQKQGFHMPLGPWFRGALSAAAGPVGSQPLLDRWFEPEFSRGLLSEHRAGENHTAVLHSLAFLQRWVQHWKPYGS